MQTASLESKKANGICRAGVGDPRMLGRDHSPDGAGHSGARAASKSASESCGPTAHGRICPALRSFSNNRDASPRIPTSPSPDRRAGHWNHRCHQSREHAQEPGKISVALAPRSHLRNRPKLRKTWKAFRVRRQNTSPGLRGVQPM